MSTLMCQAPPLPTATWDVFLSFCSSDTGYNFVSHLNAALDRQGITRFTKDPEPSSAVISDPLRQAIHNSKKYVVVLSENYASSYWCLNELEEIINCYKTTGRSVTPVFYKIDQSVVRHQIGSYKEAFENNLLSFGMEKVNKWRLALSEVAGLPGYHVSPNRYEVDIIDEIVDEILVDMTPKTLNVAKYSVGLDSRVRDITALLKIYSQGINGKTTLAEKIGIHGMGGPGKTTLPKKIGIYGMGGVGKTTLAKAVYNKNYKEFQGSCFLENVREVSRKKGLESVQQQLINDVLRHQNINIYNVDQGIEFIRARIVSTKVLIVVDDIDDPKQLEYLEGPFALGSIMIITTRNEDLLDSIKVEDRYKVNELSDAESRQLFSLHAFGDNKISEAYTELSAQILQSAGGLPLALEVLGSNFLNQYEEGVICTDKLKQVSIDHVKENLKISFDALKLVDPVLQDIFLDVACSFIGSEKEKVVEIMNTYYSFVDQKIDLLRKRSLLTINNKDVLSMHNLLMDMGREITRNNSPNEPGKHSRLWLSKDIYDVMKNHKGTEAIEVIIPHKFYHQDSLEGVSLSNETFKRMSRLRFLHLDRVNLTGNFGQTLEDLRWFCWKRCPLQFLPSEFYPQKLVILELPCSRMRTLWELNTISQVFEELKTLDIRNSLELTSTPDFAKLPCLENLILEGCTCLKEVHASIGSLVRLVSLNLGDCVNLRNLPDNICNLVALERLNIVNCSSLRELPIGLGNIEYLKELNAAGLTVSRIPDSIGWLSKLVHMRLSCNEFLQTFPDTFYDLRSLEVLDISYCQNLEILPYQLQTLIRLRELYAKGTSLLKKIPDKLPNMTSLSLKKLYLSESVITFLPSSISQLSDLEVLDLKECRNLLYIAVLPPTLKELWAKGCTSMLRLPNLSNLKQLEILELTGCSGLAEIQGLEELTSLRELPLGGCNSSLMAYTFTQRFFQIYSGFGHEIKIYAQSAEFPDWIIRSSNLGTTVSLDLLPNVSGMILCFKYCEDGGFYRLDYSVKATRSEFRCSYDGNCSHFYNESWMVIVPRSIISLTDSDGRIEIKANQEIIGIHLLYKTEITMIKYGSTTGKVDEEKIYSSKRLKHLESDI